MTLDSTQLMEVGILAEDISNYRDKFEAEEENGSWPETWDTSKAMDGLAQYLIEHGWTRLGKV